MESIDEKKQFTFASLANDRDIRVPIDGNKFFGKHIAIVGSAGSGKSHSTVKILQQAIESKDSGYDGLNNSHIIVFDIHSEYKPAFPEANFIDILNLVLPYWLLNSDELQDCLLILRQMIIRREMYSRKPLLEIKNFTV